jgi:hypothetical protein
MTLRRDCLRVHMAPMQWLAQWNTCRAGLEIDVEAIDSRCGAAVGFTGEDHGINQP